jgi:glycosyltransferase involved in cell wall biosynthesis
MPPAAKPHIVFVATAARQSGAWRIVTELARLAQADPSAAYTFITTRPLHLAGIRNPVTGELGLWRRLLFECFGIRGLLRTDGRPADVLVSLNNLGILGARGIRQYVYIHQSLPFYPELKWRLDRRELGPLFYQKLYGYFMWISIKLTSARVIVQTRTMAARVRRRWRLASLCWFPHCAAGEARAARPDWADTVAFFYPATAHPHKNHAVLGRALALLEARRPDLRGRVRVLFTLGPGELGCMATPIEYLGSCTREEVAACYARSAALLFPSLVETVGLPLVEASALGLPIICADAEYAREILRGYPGATYADPRDPAPWAQAMIAAADAVLRDAGLRRHPPHRPAIPATDLNDLKA